MKIYIPQENRFSEYEIVEDGEFLKIHDGERLHIIDLKPLGKHLFSALLDNQSYMMEAVRLERKVRLVLNQHEYVVPVLNEREKIEAEILGESEGLTAVGEIRAPMPGLILKIEVKEGDPVKTGQPLIIMEAMKMENEIRSQTEGKIEKIFVEENQKVEKDNLLLKIQ